MRKVAITLLAALVCVSMSTRESIHAQEASPTFIAGAGLGIPIDAEGINAGPAIRLGASLPVHQSLHGLLEVQYSNFGAEDTPTDLDAGFSVTGANIGVMLRPPSASTLGVYGQAGIGLTRSSASASAEGISVSATATDFSFTLGGGIHIPINPSVGVAVDARYNHALTENSATKWIPITVSAVFKL